MGVTITANNSSRSFDMGGGGFMSLRENIALAFDKEFGEHYGKLRSVWKQEDFKAFDKETDRILADDRFREEDVDIVEFLFASDCGGEISQFTIEPFYISSFSQNLLQFGILKCVIS